jgi:SAM-dependent methyltransferase
MPSIEENKQAWDGDYHWNDHGDEWSADWGSSAMQWYGTILPRIHRFVPSGTILELACGYGRWTQFLQKLCHKLMVVDISQACIEACQQRFSDLSHLEYHLNDGKSLAAIADATVDFVFSFDSLVHADLSVLEAYISQFPRILTENGAVFIHHSNLGEYCILLYRL